MFIEAVIGSIVGSAFILQNIPVTIETSTNKITTKLSDISDKVDGMNNTLLAMKSKISEIEVEHSRMFHAFQWHDLVQTLMAKNAVYLGNNILELKENDSVIQLNLVEKSITETKFGKTYKKTFAGCEYIDGKCIHYKDASCEKWFGFDGNITHTVDSNGVETWYEYDTSNRCIHKKVADEKYIKEHWYEFDTVGNLIRRRIKRNNRKNTCFHWTYNTILVEYGNVIHIVIKSDDYTSAEYYFTKDLVKTHDVIKCYLDLEIASCQSFINTVTSLLSDDRLIYYKNSYREVGGGVEKFVNDKGEEWYDDNGKIEKDAFNFLTHKYEKRIALAKHKLDEAKSIITNSI